MTPRIDQVNVVVADAAASIEFLRGLGVEIDELPDEFAEWRSHHRELPMADEGLHVDLDSDAFASWWGGTTEGFVGVVVNLRLENGAEVDRVHDLASSIGGVSRKAPWDAFWGARYAVVEGPGPLLVGLMGPPAEEARTAPPAIADFA